MASNERSLGWNTGTSNDGASTYDSSRMIAMELKTLGNGTLVTGGNLAITGASSTLTIADGAAMINGYFYETTSASTISTAGLSGTYTLALIANATGSPGTTWTVAQTAAATNTVVPSTVRMALATSAQLGVIGAGNYIAYGLVNVAATGLINSVTPYLPYAVTRQFPNTQTANLRGGTVSLTNASTYYDLTNYATSANSADNTITVDKPSGAITLSVSGTYAFSFLMKYDTNTTGTRKALIRNLDYDFSNMSAAVLPLAGDSIYQATAIVPVTVVPGTPKVFYLQAWASTAGRSVNDSSLYITRV